jgi:hypothetical protein
MKHTDLFRIEQPRSRPMWRSIFFIGPHPMTDAQAVEIDIARWETIAELHREGVRLVAGANTTINSGCCLLHYAAGCMACPVVTIGGGLPGCVGTPADRYARTPGSLTPPDTMAELAVGERAFLAKIAQKMEETA